MKLIKNHKIKREVKPKQKKNAYALVYDVIIIAFGFLVAIILSRLGIVDKFIFWFKDYYIFASFVTGIFFTSAFTLAPSSISFVHLSQKFPIEGIIFWGALGAMCGDLLLFFFVKDRFADDLKSVIKPSRWRKILKSFHFGFLKWLSPIIGALIIASPLPDEFGMTLMGMSKVKMVVLIPITFLMNALGIYLLIGFSHLL